MSAPSPRAGGLYRPLQCANGPSVPYREQPPHPALRHLIYCYWELRTTEPVDYRVIPDGCIDVFLDRNNPGDNQAMGFSDSASVFPLGAHSSFLGIRFLPGAFPLVFDVDAQDLTHRVEPLVGLCPSSAEYLNSLADRGTDPFAALDGWFLGRLARARGADGRFVAARNAIFQRRGVIEVGTELASEVGSRHLRRLFRRYIGVAPKRFSVVVRLQNYLLERLRNPSSTSYLDFGYYDQSHFIQDFRAFYGSTPGRLETGPFLPIRASGDDVSSGKG